MKNKTISIPEEIDVLLKQEENASAVITDLLMKHYATAGTDKADVIRKLEQIEIQKAMALKLAEQEKEKLLAIKKGIEVKEAEIEIAKKKAAIKPLKFKENVMKNFKDLAVREMTEAEFLEFEGRFSLNEKGFNIFKFVEEKNARKE